MTIGESPQLRTPTIQIPQWNPFLDDPSSPFGNFRNSRHQFLDSFTPLRRYLPSNEPPEFLTDDPDFPVDAFSCDHFRMYEFKVRRCARVRSHDWTDCPYAHPGEKARRRDPRKYHYSGTSCPEFRNGGCRKGDACEFAHGVFECWLHPARYRTQPCKDGPACRRRVCFFAHAPDELRVLPQQSLRGNRSGSGLSVEIGTPMRHLFESYLAKAVSYASSPTSILIPPPLSPPSGSPPISPGSPPALFDIAASMRGLRLGKTKAGWCMQNGSSFGSPHVSIIRPGFRSPPLTPSGKTGRVIDEEELWDNFFEAEQAMERVESGKDLRAKIYEKLSKENSMDGAGASGSE